MSKTPSRTQVILARLALVLSIAFVVLGLVMHGLSVEVFTRMWQNLLDRPAGPFAFRFVLQPVMAAMAAARDGIQDARAGHAPFLQAMFSDPAQRGARLDGARIATSRILLLGLAIDMVYQFIEFDTVHPAEAVIIAVMLAFVPYLVLRGLVTRVARRWVGDGSASGRR
jgi:hypothetical protein